MPLRQQTMVYDAKTSSFVLAPGPENEKKGAAEDTSGRAADGAGVQIRAGMLNYSARTSTFYALGDDSPGRGSGSVSSSDDEGGNKRGACARMREADAGGLMLALVYKKYVFELGSQIDIEPLTATVTVEPRPNEPTASALHFTRQLLGLARSQNDAAQEDVLGSCQNRPVYGTLLGLRYILGNLEFKKEQVQAHLPAWRGLLQEIVGEMARVSALALRPA